MNRTIGIYGFFVGDVAYYVGQSRNVEGRRCKHFWLLKNNRHGNDYLQKSYNKYGEDLVFKLIESVGSTSELTNRERFWIRKLNPKCNMAIPVAENWTLNAEARAKISAKVSGAKNGMFGRPSWCKGQTKATNPTLARISQKLSEQKKGVQPKQFRGIMNDEIRAKISKAHMGQKASIEARRKMSEHRKKKPVLCVETGEVFATSAIATMAVGLKSSSNIRACIKGLQNTAGQYHWTFTAEKVDE